MGDNGLAVASRSTQELLTEFVQTGRQEPFEEIVRRYAGMVYHTCLQVTRDKHDAEDAAQAVFLTLAVKSKTTPPIRYLGPWLQQVAKRLSLDLKRSKKRREAREARHHAMKNGNGNGQHHDPPAMQVEELKRVLHDELQKLPAKYRMPLILHYFGGLKPDEMAKELGCKPSTLGVRLYRGRKLLAESLAGRGISMTTALLGMGIVAAVQSVIGGKIFGINGDSDGQSADGENLIKVAISARVLGLIRATTRGMIAARIKSIVALLLLLGGVAGAGQVSGQLQPIVERIDEQIQRLLRPLMRTLNSAIEYSLGLRPLHAPLAPAMNEDDEAEQQWRQRITGYSPALAAAMDGLYVTQLAPIGLALKPEPPLPAPPAAPLRA